MTREQLIGAVAAAIRAADRRWFNEDYTEQARAALAAIERKKLAIVRQEADEAMVEKLADEMPFGRMRPEDFSRQFYEACLKIGRLG